MPIREALSLLKFWNIFHDLLLFSDFILLIIISLHIFSGFLLSYSKIFQKYPPKIWRIFVLASKKWFKPKTLFVRAEIHQILGVFFWNILEIKFFFWNQDFSRRILASARAHYCSALSCDLWTFSNWVDVQTFESAFCNAWK